MRKLIKFSALFLLFFSFSCRALLNTAPTPTTQVHLPPTASQVPEIVLSPSPTAVETITPETLTKDEQLDVFYDLWHVVNENYLYQDFNGVDWFQSFHDTETLIEEGLDPEAFYELMYQLIISLGDEHSVYLTPMEVETEEEEYLGNSDYGGVGIWVSIVPERNLATILLIFRGSPAEAAGLKAHDNILKVDGYPVLDMDGEISHRMLGTPGTPLTITVQTPGEEPRDIELNREIILATYPVPFEVIQSPDGLKIGYLFIPTFAEESIDDLVQDALEEMGELDGLIIDNRYNGGGFDNVASNTLRYFTKGVLGHFVNRFEKEPLDIRPLNIFNSQHVPLVVLVGEGTGSFGEIFSGILQDNGRAYLIGETTDGNVETLWGYAFSDGSRAWIAHDVFQPFNNPEADWEKNGIIPDLQVFSNWDLVTTETDPVVVAALDYFDSLE